MKLSPPCSWLIHHHTHWFVSSYGTIFGTVWISCQSRKLAIPRLFQKSKMVTYKLTNLTQIYKAFIGEKLSHIDGLKSGKDKRRIAKHNGRENRRYIHRVLAVVTQIYLVSKIENEKIDSVVFFSGAIETIWSNLPNITRHDSFNIVTMDLCTGIPRNTRGRKSFTENL